MLDDDIFTYLKLTSVVWDYFYDDLIIKIVIMLVCHINARYFIFKPKQLYNE